MNESMEHTNDKCHPKKKKIGSMHMHTWTIIDNHCHSQMDGWMDEWCIYTHLHTLTLLSMSTIESEWVAIVDELNIFIGRAIRDGKNDNDEDDCVRATIEFISWELLFTNHWSNLSVLMLIQPWLVANKEYTHHHQPTYLKGYSKIMAIPIGI